MINIEWKTPDPKKFEQLSIDPAMPGAEKASVTLMYPNNTRCTITGDPKIVQQIVGRLDTGTAEEEPGTPSDTTEPKVDWDSCHFVERAKKDINILHVDCAASWNKEAHCVFMDYLKDAVDAELKKQMPKLGDYEVKLQHGTYNFVPFKKETKKHDTKTTRN